ERFGLFAQLEPFADRSPGVATIQPQTDLQPTARKAVFEHLVATKQDPRRATEHTGLAPRRHLADIGGDQWRKVHPTLVPVEVLQRDPAVLRQAQGHTRSPAIAGAPVAASDAARPNHTAAAVTSGCTPAERIAA